MPGVIPLLRSWLAGRIPPDAADWLEDALTEVRAGNAARLFLAFGMVPRKTGKADLELGNLQRMAAEEARPGWNPSRWSIDHVARTLLLLAFPTDDTTKSGETLDRLFAAGEVGELVALYQALPLLDHQTAHLARAAEGLRTNIKPVFAAIAHQNPFPAEQFDEAQWNQMILKCLFVGLPLEPVVGLDERVNAPLMQMLLDYAAERRAAGRTVAPDLWRCVGPLADAAALAAMARALHDGDAAERQAVAAALASHPDPNAQALLASRMAASGDSRANVIRDNGDPPSERPC